MKKLFFNHLLHLHLIDTLFNSTSETGHIPFIVEVCEEADEQNEVSESYPVGASMHRTLRCVGLDQHMSDYEHELHLEQ